MENIVHLTSRSTLSQLVSCIFYAAGATLFFKKTFRGNILPTVLSMVLIGAILEQTDTLSLKTGTKCSCLLILTACALVYNCRQHFDWLKTGLKMDMFVFFLLAFIDVNFKGHRTIFTNMCDYQFCPEDVELTWNLVRLLVTACPQFLRKPIWLKAKLQGIRSKLGPMYVLYITCYVINLEKNIIVTSLGTTASGLAILAGLFCRPDNSAMLELLGYSTSYRSRRKLHGRLMIASFVSSMALFLYNYGLFKYAGDILFQNQGFPLEDVTTQIMRCENVLYSNQSIIYMPIK